MTVSATNQDEMLNNGCGEIHLGARQKELGYSVAGTLAAMASRVSCPCPG